MEIKYFQQKLVFFKEKYGKISDCRTFSYLKTVSRLDLFVLCVQCQRKISSSKFQAAWKRLRIVNKGRTFSYKYFLDFEEKYGKISDCWTFNYFKFSHFIAGTSATLTVCVTILICCFAWTTTSTTLSSASSSPQAGNFN